MVLTCVIYGWCHILPKNAETFSQVTGERCHTGTLW